MKQNIILTYARGYRMENDNKSGFNEGVSLNYLLTDSMAPVDDEASRGVRFSKSSIPLSKSKQVVKVPGLYEADFSMKPGSDGKILLKLDDIKFLSEIELSFPGI